MRVPVKPICDIKRCRKDGTTFIYLQYCYSWDPDLKTLLNTQIAIPPAYWDKKKLGIKETLPQQYISAKYESVEKINNELDRQQRLVCDLIKLAKEQHVVEIGAYVKEKFKPDLDLTQLAQEEFNLSNSYVPKIRKKKEPFFEHLDEYVRKKKKKGAEGSATVYDSLVLHLEAFREHRVEPITFESPVVCYRAF